MSIRDCLNTLVRHGAMSELEAQDTIKRFNRILLSADNDTVAKKQLAIELESEAAHRKRAATLTESALARAFAAIDGYRDNRNRINKAEAFLALHENFGDLGKYIGDATNKMEVIARKAQRDMSVSMETFKRGAITGDLRNRRRAQQAKMENVVEELFGNDTGDATAKAIAEAWKKVSDDLRNRFNEAGGAIGELQQWIMPQAHDREALLKVGKSEWIQRLMKDGVLDRERMVHPLSKIKYSDADLREALSVVWDRIVTDGWSDREADAAGMRRPALYKQHMDHRFLHFADGKAWLAYQREFGQPNVFATMMHHIHTMSRDIAHMETFGPNPNMTREHIKAQIMKEAGLLPKAEVIWRENHERMKALLEKFPPWKDAETRLRDDINAKMEAIGRDLSELDKLRDTYRPAVGPNKATKKAMEKLNSDLMRHWKELSELEKKFDGMDIILHEDPIVESAARDEYTQLLKESVEPDVVVAGVATDRLQAYLNKRFAKADAMWENMRGSAPVDTTWANRMAAARNIVSASSLGGAWFSSWADPAHGQLMRQRMGMSLMKSNAGVILARSLKEMVTMMGRDEAVSSSLGLDSALNTMRQASAMGSIDPRSWSGFIADRVLTYTMLIPWTQAGKHLAGMDIMRWMGKLSKHEWGDIPERTRDVLVKHGLGRDEWARLKDAPLHNGMLRENEVSAVAGRGIGERYLAMILRETRHAVPETTVESRSVVTSIPAGTLYGEMIRSVGQFKGFPIAVGFLLGRWIARDMMGGKSNVYQHAAAYMISAMILGAVAMALKDLAAGRDPRRWLDEKTFLDPKMWGAAILQSGGLGIYGDLLFSDVNRQGGSLQKTVAGPMVDRVDTALQLVAQPFNKAMGKKTHAGRLGLDMARQWMPGQNMWMTNLIVQRLMFDQLHKMADPEAAASFRTQEVKRITDYGQRYWWRPGQQSPDRWPDISRILATR